MIAARFVGYTCASENQPELLVLLCCMQCKKREANLYLVIVALPDVLLS